MRERNGGGVIKVLLADGRAALRKRLAGLLVSFGGSELTDEPLESADAFALTHEKQPDVAGLGRHTRTGKSALSISLGTRISTAGCAKAVTARLVGRLKLGLRQKLSKPERLLQLLAVEADHYLGLPDHSDRSGHRPQAL